ncbi:TetR family transcriptional regulator [Enterococcus ratti]|uniref:TetR family transcriptional regulator n=1 Tax=Enterococcus ratti TaxID=150033 RepID=UPI000900053F|nr:TetR family transcriptional regulator [Enterococcus ratti]
MSEIQQLIHFMRSGKRKQITLKEYEYFVRKEGWTNESKAKLINQIQKSDILHYECCKHKYIIRLIR